MSVTRLSAFAVLSGLSFLLVNCSSSTPASPVGGTGGSTPAGGTSTATGGVTATGGAATSGGMSSSGGSNGGGATQAGASSGGSSVTGGATATGGNSTSGGTSAIAGSSSGGTSTAGGAGNGGTSTVGGASGGASAGTSAGGAVGGSGGATGGTGGGSSGGPFKVTSPDHEDGAKFGTAFTCAAMNGMFGSGVNPELNWTGVPAGTKSFAITFIDTKLGENSAMGQHWAAWNIPATAMQLPKGTTSFSGPLMGAKQTNKYLSPCPSGNDTYEFTVYALPVESLSVTGAEGTGVANSAGVAKVLAALKMANPLGNAKLSGTSGPMGK
ncbi:MAG TPA: YbhB/YbcL family Raf kinase inhibitor-like protein [Polyangiaceae bacterium]|nr:YbhB/YbcL family Raf kinase inhibitor-like protein [Polyangiaceae bacterium]